MFAEDLDIALAECGEPARFGALACLVLLDMPDHDVLGGSQISADYSITFKSTELPGLKNGSAITVDGVAYKVREVFKLDDGALSRANLKR